ncbi:FYVE, RhoGEF and PH domain-containing protein 4-like isoform X4 [Macrobrachium rosenbergii]|uniref:FYVE, RhoGEF and PH domain-containing protein 4-like isoform X4 n=2 Tax=Macrobrachium rosenbergii TaxID=79674 RepID=UPI0034D51DE6
MSYSLRKLCGHVTNDSGHCPVMKCRTFRLRVMAVAEEDAGVTLVSFSRSRPLHRSQPSPSAAAAKPPTPTTPRPRRPRNTRRSLSRLLSRCTESGEEEEEDQPEGPSSPAHHQQKQSIGLGSDPQQRLANGTTAAGAAGTADLSQHDAKIQLVGFRRSHSFCGDAKRSNRRISWRSSSSCRSYDCQGQRDSVLGPQQADGQPWPYECSTLKTSREVKMERERLRRARGGETLWADKEDVFTNFMRQSQDRFTTLLEERGFTHIPPPAGFGAPTRPSSLLAALACGPTSLDEGQLSGAAHRRTAYTMRRSATAGFPGPLDNKENENEGSGVSGDADDDSPPESGVKEDEDDEEEPWCDLPASPLSPPSPFHHPFFRRQLGLPTPVADPWARFSGFGMPRLPQVLLAHAQAQQEAAAARNEEWNQGGPRRDIGRADDYGVEKVERRRHSANPTQNGRGQYCMTSRQRIVTYCADSNSYKVCTETHFLSDSFGDGVSETESEDEEDDGAPPPATHHQHHNNTNTTTTTPSSTRSLSRAQSPARTDHHHHHHHHHHHSRPHSPLSDMDTESKRNSQAVSTEPSEIDDHSSVTTSDLESCHDPSSPRSSLLATETTHAHHLDHAVDHAHDARKDKAYRIALELLHTERTYVKVLHLIDQEFQFRVDNENRAHHMFPQDIIPHMFSNVKSIYKLHHDFLLPQLEDRMAQWEQNRRIGDIMKSFAPFLKMYTEYVRNFDNAMTLINQWQSKCPRFAAIMDEIHSMEACANLTLQHHMLSPVQRIPRYEMLIRDYLKKLPEDSPDRHDTEKALQLVSMAANHANDAMKKIDKFEKLLEIQESLGGAVDLVSPTRELVKEGKIIKISARSGDHQERYVFLLTDLLLLCSPRLMGGRVMSGPQYRLRAKYNVDNLQVLEGDNLETANTFYIRDNNKSVELYTQTKEEKELWLEALFQAIHETYQRKSSLKLHFSPDQRVVDVDLGQKQPTLVRSDSVTKCMECGSQFTMVRRKHHCRACGAVVCNKCSSFKASLAYESGKNVRVCRTCHTTLQELSSSTATPSPEIDDSDECAVHSTKEQSDMAFRSRGVLEVSAKTGGAVMEGFLQLKTHRKAWVKRWFALHTDFVLYSFKCEADEQALTATPVPGFTVTHLQGTRNESGISDKEKERAFKLHHSKKHYIFQAASKDESLRWVAALKKASQAELPSPVQ